MITAYRPAQPTRRKQQRGQTLIELVVSMTLATILMLGLGSCLFIVSSAFDGSTDAVKCSLAAEVQADVMTDLNQATEIVARSANSITFTVPDRNNDGTEETLTYTWSGASSRKLTYTENGKRATLLKDVTDFRLTYLDRVMPGSYPALPAVEPDEWGRRWETSLTFGQNTVFPYNSHEEKNQVGTLVTLTESAMLQSISAHFTITANGGWSPVRLAIYDVDSSDNPRNLLASTIAVDVSTTGWTTIRTAPTPLAAGNYYLALSIQRASKVASNYEIGGGATHVLNHNAATHDFKPSWGTSNMVYSVRSSIYATCERN